MNTSCSDARTALADTLLPEQPPQDAVLLLARTRALDADLTASWTLPNDPRVVNDARRRVAGRLSEWGLDDLEDDTALVVSELVTNAVRYARGPIELRLVRDQTPGAHGLSAGLGIPSLSVFTGRSADVGEAPPGVIE
ncbi:ATP-binding protein [Streptomyces sp. NRRL S-813]|uniref:ATP-binding protein n=1 Tax=Streptomyces sp. NRRL S-813 TaxID=1463919 RepID=UPI0004BF9A19|nr:ATP-binding protein [Streptomyces sp. NRRL S-813]